MGVGFSLPGHIFCVGASLATGLTASRKRFRWFCCKFLLSQGSLTFLWKSGGGSGRVAPKQIKAKELTSHVASGELLRLSKLRKTKCCCGVEFILFERALGAKK